MVRDKGTTAGTMQNLRRSLLIFAAALTIAGGVATGAIGRPGLSADVVPGPLAADSIACVNAGGEFHAQPWRVPPTEFAGYHCIFQSDGVPGTVPADVQAAAAKRCANAHHGEYMQIAVDAYAGYACTWLRG